jgi:hypothetical protein
MRDEERKQIHALAASAFGQVPELWQSLLHELNRMGQARKEIVAELVAGSQAGASSTTVVSLYRDAAGAQGSLYDRTLTLVAAPLERLQPLLAGDTVVPAIAATPAADVDLAAAVAQLRAAGLGLDTAKLFLGLLLLLLNGSVAGCIDTCEAFLGRTVGSHQAKRRLWRVVREALGTAAFDFGAPALFPPLAIPLVFRSTLTEVVQQLNASPEHDGVEAQIKIATGMAKLEALVDVAKTLDGRIPDLERYAQTCADAILEERNAVGEAMRSISRP